MASKHTPGPWAVTKAKHRKVTANGVLICNAALRNSATAKQNTHGKGEERAEANARLIAAAPELLEACKALLERYRIMVAADGPECLLALAAITKATLEIEQ